MITEDFCSYEIAKLLKDKGFDEPCLSFFWSDEENVEYTEQPFTNKQLYLDQTLRPTLQMAMKWLREVHNIFITVYLFDREKPFTENSLYTCDIATNKMSSQQGHLRGIWTTYEVAVETTIKYVLENLI